MLLSVFLYLELTVNKLVLHCLMDVFRNLSWNSETKLKRSPFNFVFNMLHQVIHYSSLSNLRTHPLRFLISQSYCWFRIVCLHLSAYHEAGSFIIINLKWTCNFKLTWILRCTCIVLAALVFQVCQVITKFKMMSNMIEFMVVYKSCTPTS